MDWLRALLDAFGRKQSSQFAQRSLRIRCNLPAQVASLDGHVQSAGILDLSALGFRLHVKGGVSPGAQVLVHFQGRLVAGASIVVKAQVVWSRQHPRGCDAGMQFINFHDTAYDDVVHFFRNELNLDMSDTARRLRAPRLTAWSYELRFAQIGDLRGIKGVVQNISTTGLRFFSEETVPLGAELQITLIPPEQRRSITLHGTVRRCQKVEKGVYDVAAVTRPEGAYDVELLETELAALEAQ
ncbi:MAG: PilZ domain-containing protein [Candidatus Xenobia bacterium]